MSSYAIGPHLLDTGPVLCLGGSAVMAELYDAHLADEGAVVAIVGDEVRAWSSAHVPPGDPRRIGGVKRAGAGAVARYANTLLSAALPTPIPEPAAISVIRRDLEDQANRKRPGRKPRANEHAGEAYSIHEAVARSLRFVSNDDGARRVAGARSVAHESFADIARRLVTCQREVKSRQILKELHRLVREGLDIGDVVNSVLDLRMRGASQ